MSGISYHLKLRGMEDYTSDFLVKQALRGAARALPSLPDGRLAISIGQLSQLIAALRSVTSDRFEFLLFRAAFLLAFFACLRIGEVTSRSSRDRRARLLRDGVSLIDERIIITLVSAKTSKNLPQRASIPNLPEVAHLLLALRRYIAVKPSTISADPFFVHSDGLPLTQYQFRFILNRAVAHAHLPSFAAHSFRIGGASFFASAGLSEQEIKQAGRWASDAYKTYLRPI
jgi:hypothetical protein